MGHKGSIICLVKPLFEVESMEARRTGIIHDDSLYADILTSLADFMNNTLGLNVFGITHSRIRGSNGTIEFFVGISLDDRDVRLRDSDIMAEVHSAIIKTNTEVSAS